MNHCAKARVKRMMSLAAALTLAANITAFAEDEGNAMNTEPQTNVYGEHFVPENPDMDKATLVELDLGAYRTAPTAYTAPEGEGVLLAGGEISKCAFPLPYQVMKGNHVKLTVKGRFDGDLDKGITVFMTDDGMNNCSNATMIDVKNDGSGSFRA